jgi:hypothetical protein
MGENMKPIAIISLISILLTTNYAYATFPTQELVQKINQAQYQKRIQEEVEELLFTIIASVDGETLAMNADILPSQLFICYSFLFITVIAYSTAMLYADLYPFFTLSLFLFCLFMLGLMDTWCY